MPTISPVSLQGALAGVARQGERTPAGLRPAGDPRFLQGGTRRRELRPRTRSPQNSAEKVTCDPRRLLCVCLFFFVATLQLVGVCSRSPHRARVPGEAEPERFEQEEVLMGG